MILSICTLGTPAHQEPPNTNNLLTVMLIPTLLNQLHCSPGDIDKHLPRLKESLKMMIFSKMFWKAHVHATQSPLKKAIADLPAVSQLLAGVDVGKQRVLS